MHEYELLNKGPAIKHYQLPFTSCAPTCMPRACQLILRLLFHIHNIIIVVVIVAIADHLLSGHTQLSVKSRKV